jgi:hypothetical protein
VKAFIEKYQRAGWKVAILSDTGPATLAAILDAFEDKIEVDQIWGQNNVATDEQSDQATPVKKWCNAPKQTTDPVECFSYTDSEMKVGAAKQIAGRMSAGTTVTEWLLVDNSIEKFGEEWKKDCVIGSPSCDLRDNGQYVDKDGRFRLYLVGKSVANYAASDDKGWKKLEAHTHVIEMLQ